METWITDHPLLALLTLAWIIIWKGLALWKAAGLQQKYWFMALLVINTFGLLEIFYLYAIGRKYEVKVLKD
ncbi:MAG: hypothetical protein AB200_02125 [Parcubacteria bacterium C7867-005]|nr:MAG: hypothetical protein AB200_02125 [Parcubacteria bacterium C7867-005]